MTMKNNPIIVAFRAYVDRDIPEREISIHLQEKDSVYSHRGYIWVRYEVLRRSDNFRENYTTGDNYE